MTNHYYHLLATLILALFPASLMAQAPSDTAPAMDIDTASAAVPQPAVHHSAQKHKIVAVISSFAQDSPWSDDYIPLVTAAASSNANTYCEIYYLQSLQITDSITYNKVKEAMFEYYSERKPDYVVMIGKMAFTMRDEMKKEWGDIPMFLIANSADYAPLDYYFSGTKQGSEAEVVQKGKLHEMQKDYNFTALIVPYLYRQTVKLMLETMHRDINELVFVAVPTYVDRNNSKRISEYLAETYPGIQYRWLSADTENIEELRSLLIDRQPGTGILLSNWAVIGKSPFGDNIIINQESKLLSSSVNPVFVASASLINNGAVGGVFLNREDIKERINTIVDAMLDGKDMSRIPIYKCEEETKIINYERAKQYGLNISDLGNDVVFVGYPLSFWDKYRWQTLIVLMVLFLIGVLIWKRSKSQAKEIELLQMHQKFVKGMPVAYARATFYLSQDGKSTNNVIYSEFNDNMEDLASETRDKDGQYVLFPVSFINEKAQELFQKGGKVEFLHPFVITRLNENTKKVEKIDTFYDIVIRLAAATGGQKANTTVREIDIFAVDVTKRVNKENEVKELSRKLDLTLNAAGVIPWEWDIKRDVLRFDAYSLFGRQLHDVDDMKEAPCTYLDVSKEFMPLIHPEDKPKLDEQTMKLLTKAMTSFVIRYRLHVVRDGVDCYQWVKIKGTLTEFDSKGNPTKAAGGMWMLDDEDLSLEPVI